VIYKNTIFSRKNKEYKVSFLSEEISSDASALLLEKIERENNLIKNVSSLIPEKPNIYWFKFGWSGSYL
jgi:hypothetical protein